MEPWPCFLSWQQQAAGRLHPPRLKMEVRARQRLDVNITSVLLGKFKSHTDPGKCQFSSLHPKTAFEM